MPTITQYRTGIDVTLSGAEGVDWAVEQLYHDPKLSRLIYYVKAATEIGFAHNARNVARVSGANYNIIGANAAIIRYKVDGDRHYLGEWTGKNGTSTEVVNAAYSTPLTFATLTYPSGPAGGGAVLGATGDNGEPYVPKVGHFHYGMIDGAGDEYHTITIADDDWTVTGTDTEWRASDGRVCLFCVNPKTCHLKLSKTGDAQWWTSEAKVYFIPKIHDQETVLLPRTGTITLTLTDLYGGNVFWRIVDDPDSSAAYTDAGASSATLTDANFSDGVSYLQYYRAGYALNRKTRIIRKNPAFPSGGETHGYLWAGSYGNLATINTRITQSPYQYGWGRLVGGANGGRAAWPTILDQGHRTVNANATGNALLLRVLGSSAKQAGQVKTYGRYSLEMCLENGRLIDNVGFEMSPSQRTLPTRELIYRGYYDVNQQFDLVYAYDIIAALYRSDQVAEGMTTVEDYFLRDCIASYNLECMMYQSHTVSTTAETDTGGMWDVARKCGAVVGMFAIPSYISRRFGTCGLDGNTTVYADTPFPNTPLTWKQAFLDEDQPMVGYPNLAKRLGIAGYNCRADGHFIDRAAYVGHMTGPFANVANLLKWHYPSKTIPAMEAFFLRCTDGTVLGLKDGSGPTQVLRLPMFSSNFPDIADVGIPIVTNAVGTASNSDNQLINGNFAASLANYDVDYVVGVGVPDVAPYFTVQPVGATRTEGEEVTFTCAAAGTPTPTLQWLRDGVVVDAATGTSYTISAAAVVDSGIYTCAATNSVSTTISAAATLVVNAIPPEPDPVTKRTNYKTPAAGLLSQ